MIDSTASCLKGSHHIPAYSLHLEWTPDSQNTDYEPVYDGLVLNEENIHSVVQRIRASLLKDEPVIVTLFTPKVKTSNIAKAKSAQHGHR